MSQKSMQENEAQNGICSIQNAYTANVLEWLEKTASAFPDKIAFADPETKITFGQLIRKAQAVGTLLADRIGIGSPVAFYMEKSVNAIAAMFGVVYAGGFYSFVDVRQPVARAAKVLDVLEPAMILTDDENAEKAETLKEECEKFNSSAGTGFSNSDIDADEKSSTGEKEKTDSAERESSGSEGMHWVRLEDLLSDADRMTDDGREPEGEESNPSGRITYDLTEKLAAIRGQVTDNDILYVNFTSGSTGTPKGVAVSHRSVIDFISHFVPLFGINERDVIANQAPFDFDVSVKDIYSGLYSGARVQLIPRDYFTNPTELMDYLCDHEATVLIWAVSAMCFVSIMNGLSYKTPETIRLVMFSGEVMPVKQLNVWKKYLPDATYVNLYGPTEITCNCTYYVLPKEKEWKLTDVIPAGKAFPNEKVFLLAEESEASKNVVGHSPEKKENGSVKLSELKTDHNRYRLIKRSDSGAEGEICVGGTCLALGYYRDSARTEASFVQNPLNDRYPERIYRTGDIGRYDAEGNLVYVSRKDFQIKRMGHRIELGEIEADAMALEGVSRAACVYEAEKKRLILFYTGERDRKGLESELKEALPPFMIPNKTIKLNEMPLNKNGKIDRTALMNFNDMA